MALFTLATVSTQILNTKSVFADDGDYPWIDAHALYSAPDHTSSYGYTSPCPSKDTECMNGGSTLIATVNGVTYGEADLWHYGLRNCTSYVAWKVNQVFGVNIHGWGDAYQWASNAPASEVHTASSGYGPVAGDIAQWNSASGDSDGHVAYVSKVTNGTVYLLDYNVAWDGNFNNGYTTTTEPNGAPNNYIHVGTHTSVTAFQANNNNLYIYDATKGTTTNTQQGMASGTSPAIADTADGYVVAFHAANGDLFTYDVTTGTATDTQQGMASGTSPSIAATPTSGYRIAFQANTSGNYMYFYDYASGAIAGNQGLASGTSPSITYVSGGYEEAFQGNGNDDLYVYGSTTGNTGYVMQTGTSPSISAPVNGSSFELAYEATNNIMYVYGGGQSYSTGLSMSQGTSPSMMALAYSGYEEDYQGSNADLWYDSSNGYGDTSQGIASSTSPSISAHADGSNNFEAAFQANNNYLYTWSSASGSATNTLQGMASGTSPAISAQ